MRWCSCSTLQSYRIQYIKTFKFFWIFLIFLLKNKQDWQLLGVFNYLFQLKKKTFFKSIGRCFVAARRCRVNLVLKSLFRLLSGSPAGLSGPAEPLTKLVSSRSVECVRGGILQASSLGFGVYPWTAAALSLVWMPSFL